MGIVGDVVSFGTGRAGGWSEIWTTVDTDWEGSVRRRIRCVRDGRYSERSRTGWLGRFSARKVEMRFGGVPGRKGRDLVIRFSSTVRWREEMPPTGEFTYDRWWDLPG